MPIGEDLEELEGRPTKVEQGPNDQDDCTRTVERVLDDQRRRVRSSTTTQAQRPFRAALKHSVSGQGDGEAGKLTCLSAVAGRFGKSTKSSARDLINEQVEGGARSSSRSAVHETSRIPRTCF